MRTNLYCTFNDSVSDNLAFLRPLRTLQTNTSIPTLPESVQFTAQQAHNTRTQHTSCVVRSYHASHSSEKLLRSDTNSTVGDANNLRYCKKNS